MKRFQEVPAVILARGGSKGIPRKNLQRIGAKSLVRRAAEEAAKSKFAPVFVYSDDDEILAEGQAGGAEPRRRPEEMAQDDTTSDEAVAYFLEHEDPKEEFKAVALIQCTTPFLRSRHMTAAYDLFMEEDWDSVITAARFTRFLGYEKYDRKSRFVPQHPIRALRQQMDWNLWVENGGIYLALREIWINHRRIGFRCGVVEMSLWESLEIDEPQDLLVARLLAAIYLDDVNLKGVRNGTKEIEEGNGKVGEEDEEARQDEEGRRHNEGVGEERIATPRGFFEELDRRTGVRWGSPRRG